MKMFKHTAYTLIGAAALLSLSACSPDEVELEPITFEFNYNLSGEYSYEPNDYTSFEVSANGSQFKLGTTDYDQIQINLDSNVDYNASVSFDIETPDWVTTNHDYLTLSDYSGNRIGRVVLNLIGNTYSNTVFVNGEEYTNKTNNQVVFAVVPNPDGATRTGNIKISVSVDGATGTLTIPFSQTGTTDAAAPTAISFTSGSTQYGDPYYELHVDYPESAGTQYILMVTPLSDNITDTENILRNMGAYAWMHSQPEMMTLCQYYESISKNNFLDYHPLYCENVDYKAIAGIIRHTSRYTDGYNFNGFSRYAVYTISLNAGRGTTEAFNVTVFDANGNIVE